MTLAFIDPPHNVNKGDWDTYVVTQEQWGRLLEVGCVSVPEPHSPSVTDGGRI